MEGQRAREALDLDKFFAFFTETSFLADVPVPRSVDNSMQESSILIILNYQFASDKDTIETGYKGAVKKSKQAVITKEKPYTTDRFNFSCKRKKYIDSVSREKLRMKPTAILE